MGEGGSRAASAADTSRVWTFLFTDIEGSTRLWDAHPGAMRDALEQHDELLRTAVEGHGGRVLKSTGDGMIAVFDDATRALTTCAVTQRELAHASWGAIGVLRVRMGVHAGTAAERDGDYFGPTLNRAARLMALAHGGQVVVSEVATLLARESDRGELKLIDLGEHRLRDLAQTERVFQLVADGIEREFPPLRSLDAYATNLPFQVTSFVGREDDVDALTSLVRAHRMVTLTGVGGVGKTRLAERVAAEMLPDVRDGVWLCELAGADAEDAALEIVSRALGVTPRAGMSRRDSIVDHLLGRDCIVVLDNCEHLLDVAADLADAILHRCAHVRLIATSREGLGVDGEQLRPIRSLPLPAAATLAGALSCDATELFAERASAVAPSFVVDDSNAPSVVEICRRLDGIPLAIELAAARVASLQPAEIAALLDERFRLLTGSRRRSVERHQTLRATVDWSYSLLTDSERAVFDRLGAFVGSFDAAAAQAVVASDGVDRFEVLDALSELVAKSMLTAEPAPDGTTRYQLLETLRQYALEQLQEGGEIDVYRRRHAEHYVTVSAAIGAALYGPDEIAARARLDRETDNLRAAVDWAIEVPERAIALGLLDPLAREAGWNRGGEIGAWCERALALEGDEATAWHLVRLAVGYEAFNAFSDLEQSLCIADAVLADEHARPDDRSWALQLRGTTLSQMGDMEGAITALTEDYERDPGRDDHQQGVAAAAILAIYLAIAGDDAHAVAVAEEALRRARAGGGPSSIALAHYALGQAHSNADPDIARRELEEALRLGALGSSNVVRDRSLLLLATITWRAGEVAGAALLVARALAESLSTGDYGSSAYSVQLAQPVLASGRRWEALCVLDQALASGTLPINARFYDDITRAALAAVEAAEAALGSAATAAARASELATDRDEVQRFAMAELEAIAHAESP